VLFGSGGGNRWTSTGAQVIADDGQWSTYTFSTQEADLTQVLGAGTYADLSANLNRIMFRHNTGGPSAGGTPIAPTAGVFGIDNVIAVPEPSTLMLSILALVGLALRRSAVRTALP